MWICVWAGSGAQEEIQPAAFRLAQEYSSLSSSRLGNSQQRDAFADLICYFAGFRQWGEEEDSQTSGLANRVSPMKASFTGQRYKNGLMQRDSIGFEERSTERYREVSPARKVQVALRRRC